MKLYEARYEGGVLAFNSWRFLKISGEDSDAYIQNHVTNDLTSCKLNFAQLNARLDRGGKIQSSSDLVDAQPRLASLRQQEKQST